MSDIDSLSGIIDDLITVLEEMEVDEWEKESVEFGVNLLKYVVYLARKDGIDLSINHSIDDLSVNL